jgi:hypothetical protein
LTQGHLRLVTLLADVPTQTPVAERGWDLNACHVLSVAQGACNCKR